MMPSNDPIFRIARPVLRGEYILPAPFEACARILARERIGQMDLAEALPQGEIMNLAHFL